MQGCSIFLIEPQTNGAILMDGTGELKHLGWANGWSDDPEIVKECKAKGHEVSDESDAPGVRYKCFVHTVRCYECGYQYKYDSS